LLSNLIKNQELSEKDAGEDTYENGIINYGCTPILQIISTTRLLLVLQHRMFHQLLLQHRIFRLIHHQQLTRRILLVNNKRLQVLLHCRMFNQLNILYRIIHQSAAYRGGCRLEAETEPFPVKRSILGVHVEDDGSADDDAYNNCTIVVEDVSTSTQKAVGMVLDYTGSTKTVTLKEALAFTIATTDGSHKTMPSPLT